jgi:hypothetical protein
MRRYTTPTFQNPQGADGGFASSAGIGSLPPDSFRSGCLETTGTLGQQRTIALRAATEAKSARSLRRHLW